MQRIKPYISGKMILVFVLFFVIITAAVTFAYKKTKETAGSRTVSETTPSIREIDSNSGPADSRTAAPPAPETTAAVDDATAKVVLGVDNMSCSGCIATIKGSLDGIAGIKDVIVDIANGKTDVYYDNRMVPDVSRIEGAITASGYPAKVQRVLTAEAVKKEQDMASAKSQHYIASVGGWDIARADFETELKIAKKRYTGTYGDAVFSDSKGQVLENNLKSQIAAQLINEGVFMQEIQKAGFKLDREVFEDRLNTSLKAGGQSMDDLKKAVAEMGYDFDYFKKKHEIKILINTYIEEKVTAGAGNEFEKQNAFKAWYSNSKVLAEVVYYDKNLERLQQSQSGSGGCCSVN
jgi:copper chaperone CopZ